MAKANKKEAKIENNSKLFAFISVLLTIVGFLIALIFRRDDDYIMFYAKQSLGIFILQAIAKIASLVPFTGDLVAVPLWILFFVLCVIALINSLSGQKKLTPLIGKWSNAIRI